MEQQVSQIGITNLDLPRVRKWKKYSGLNILVLEQLKDTDEIFYLDEMH